MPCRPLRSANSPPCSTASFGAASLQYRVILGPNAGSRLLTLRNTLSSTPASTKPFTAAQDGFSLNAAVACQAHQSVRYFRASRLFDTLTLAHGDGSFGKLLMQLAKTELLIIGDWGFDVLNQQQRNDLLEVVEDRHGSGATLITSQLPIAHWHEAVGDPTLADAILDRVLHGATKIQMKGESMRKKLATVDRP